MFFSSSCTAGQHNTLGHVYPSPPKRLTITVNYKKRFQTIDGFGASDAWSLQYVGKNWPVLKRNRIADLLFSTSMDSTGSPEGIGLSIWRFNIGAGSSEQGDSSGITNPWRRAEGFLQDDGTYDWSHQSGQQWFLKAAVKRGVFQFIGFTNSPPVQLTCNRKSYGDGGTHVNLTPDKYDDFADFLVRVISHFKKQGISFNYVSPANEPQWDWGRKNNQEGSPWQNKELTAFAKVLNKKIIDAGLKTKIEIPESGQITFLYGDGKNGRDQQVKNFFSKGPDFVGNLTSVAHLISSHSYFTTWPVSKMIVDRKHLWETINTTDPNLKYWMTEYCILANNKEIHGRGRDLGMSTALYVARLIHFDLTLANASSWQWWLAVSPNDFKDGLVYLDAGGKGIQRSSDSNATKLEYNGNVRDSKLLWAFGNYSRFIRPGSVRLSINRSDKLNPEQTSKGLMVSAYTDKKNRKITLVLVNYSSNKHSIKLDFSNLPAGKHVLELHPYVTSATTDLASTQSFNTNVFYVVPPKSVVTLTGNIE